MRNGRRLYVCPTADDLESYLEVNPIEIDGIDDSVAWEYIDVVRWNEQETAGITWFLVPAHNAEDAMKTGRLLDVGVHPDQQDFEFFHAQIRAGLNPSPDELPEPEPCLLPRLQFAPW